MESKLANKKHLPQGLILKSIIFYKMFLKLWFANCFKNYLNYYDWKRMLHYINVSRCTRTYYIKKSFKIHLKPFKSFLNNEKH